jgi:hypothetical protein
VNIRQSSFGAVERVLRRHTFGTLSTLSGQGRPHATGVVYAVSPVEEPLTLYVTTRTTTPKVRNVRAQAERFVGQPGEIHPPHVIPVAQGISPGKPAAFRPSQGVGQGEPTPLARSRTPARAPVIPILVRRPADCRTATTT